MGGETWRSGISAGLKTFAERVAGGGGYQFRETIWLYNATFDKLYDFGGAFRELWGPPVAIAHELAHYWDWKTGDVLSKVLNAPGVLVGGLPSAIGFEPGPTQYARTDIVEDWAESVAGFLYSEYFEWLTSDPNEWYKITLSDGQVVKVPPSLGPQHYQ